MYNDKADYQSLFEKYLVFKGLKSFLMIPTPFARGDMTKLANSNGALDIRRVLVEQPS